jgi:hypothetical protein
MSHTLYRVTGFQVLENFTVQVQFNDGSEQVIDFEPVLYGEMWGPLRDRELFRQVTLDPVVHTLTWPNGADFDPETLRHWPRHKDELAARAQTWAQMTV